MKKEYLEPQSTIITLPCFVWMTEGMSGMGSGKAPGEGSGYAPLTPSKVKTV